MNNPVLFDTWWSLGRVFIVGGAAYVVLIVMLRISGKRTLSKMNAFDLVVTVALGSTLATVLLDRNVPFAEGIAALALLIALQFVITWLAVRSQHFQKLVKSEPTMLVHRGICLESAMRHQRVTIEEIQAALRAAGLSSTAEAASVVLETDGSMTVVPQASGTQAAPAG